jgi:hypothetical protein
MTTLDGGVIIKRGNAPAPPSGGTSESNIEYLDVSGFPAEVEPLFLMFSILAKYSTEYGTVIATPFMTANINVGKQFKAVMIDFTTQICEMGHIGTIKDALIAQGITQADLDSIPRITKEEFYTLD